MALEEWAFMFPGIFVGLLISLLGMRRRHREGPWRSMWSYRKAALVQILNFLIITLALLPMYMLEGSARDQYLIILIPAMVVYFVVIAAYLMIDIRRADKKQLEFVRKVEERLARERKQERPMYRAKWAEDSRNPNVRR